MPTFPKQQQLSLSLPFLHQSIFHSSSYATTRTEARDDWKCQRAPRRSSISHVELGLEQRRTAGSSGTTVHPPPPLSNPQRLRLGLYICLQTGGYLEYFGRGSSRPLS